MFSTTYTYVRPVETGGAGVVSAPQIFAKFHFLSIEKNSVKAKNNTKLQS